MCCIVYFHRPAPLPWKPLPGAPLPGAQLHGAQLPGEQLPGAQLPGEQLPGEQLLGAQLPGEQLPRAQLPGEQLPRAQLPVKQLSCPACTDLDRSLTKTAVASHFHMTLSRQTTRGGASSSLLKGLRSKAAALKTRWSIFQCAKDVNIFFCFCFFFSLVNLGMYDLSASRSQHMTLSSLNSPPCAYATDADYYWHVQSTQGSQKFRSF